MRKLILLALGVYVLIRFTAFGLPTDRLGKPLRKRFLGPLGLVAGFVDSTGGGGWGPVGTSAILAGGVVAAPIAAWIVRHIPPRILGSAVGGIIILTNTRTLLTSDWIDAPEQARYVIYAAIYGLWAAAVAYSIKQYQAHRERERLAVA